MITTPEEYNSHIAQITDPNIQRVALLLPSDEIVYDIDLDTRKIQAPEFLSVSTDHVSEAIYFKLNRYHDNQDLADTTPIIIYENKKDPQKKQWAYSVPYIDPYTFGKEGKIIIPWAISGAATKYAGEVEFFITFIRVNKNGKILYRLNTLPAKSKILHTMNMQDYLENNDEYFQIANQYEELLSRIGNIEKEYNVYWLEV